MPAITLNLSENDLDVLRNARSLSSAAQVALAEYRVFSATSDDDRADAAYDRWRALDTQAERDFAFFARICSVQITGL